jgi:glycine/D-amino acid oxidase-like deaminating enzyme
MAEDNPVAIPASGTEFEVIIIGGGTIGLSAAYYARTRNLTTLLVEQSEQLANDDASSHGYSRIFRIMHSEEYSAKLAEIAFALWHEIETASNIKILKRQPLIFHGLKGKTPEGNLENMKDVLDDLGVFYEWYGSGRALEDEFPVFKNVPSDYVALVQPNSAVIRAARSIVAFTGLAKSKGATILTNQKAKVTKIPEDRNSGQYEVTCGDKIYKASKLILAPSAWTNQVLQPFGIQLNLTIWQMTVAYFEAEVSKFDYPLWYEFGPVTPTDKLLSSRRSLTQSVTPDKAASEPQALFYGFPPDEKPGYIKVSADFTDNQYTDPCDCTNTPDPNILSELRTFLQRRFNGVRSNSTCATSCLYTMSNDFQMVLDQLPGHPNVAIFTGDSGRGFKFTPLIGRVLLDIATKKPPRCDISKLRIERSGIIRRTLVN